MIDELRPLRINAVELLRQPGAVRDVDVVVEAVPLDALHERLDGDVHVELRLEALNDGIKVTGTVSARWATVCRRCLADVAGVARGDVDELYQIQPLDPDAYLIEDGQLDLVPLVRETVLIELDLERQCRDECAGLCPVCGVDRNTTECDCDPTVRDDRWAALEGFVPDDER
ncbi:MAG: DUF177 domain-containing protein [Ilumatobacteraceae bacterium]|jgi:uncharacterized protein